MEYTLIFGKQFDKEFNKLDNSLKQQLWKKLERLKENPESGKHLRHLNIWEIKVEMYRTFYIIDKNQIRVVLLSIQHKDDCDKYVRGLSMNEIRQQLNGAS